MIGQTNIISFCIFVSSRSAHLWQVYLLWVSWALCHLLKHQIPNDIGLSSSSLNNLRISIRYAHVEMSLAGQLMHNQAQVEVELPLY